MPNKTFNTRTQQKRGNQSDWVSATNFTPLDGEIIYYKDINAIKMGNGSTKVNNLPFTSSNDKYTTHYPTMTGTAAVTSSPYYCSRWNASDTTISELYDGLTLHVKIPVAGNGTYGTGISINNGDYHPVVYNVSSMVGTRYGVNSTVVLVYNSDAVGKLYLNSTSALDVTGCWQAMDYSTNTGMLMEYYFRPYAAAALYRYKVCAQDKDNRLIPLTTTNQTSATIVEKTPTSVAFKPYKLFLYYSTSTVSAGSQVAAQTIYPVCYVSNGWTYNLNETVDARRMVYYCGTYDTTTGLFTLDTTKNASNQYRSYYTLVPYNTANITLSDYFISGKDYILAGSSYSSSNYLQLFETNPMYHFDGTNLIPYDTWAISQAGGGGDISVADGILDGSLTNDTISFTPYTTRQSGLTFDTSTTAPTGTSRLNLNGKFYATELYEGSTRVSTTDQNVAKTAASDNVDYPLLFANAATPSTAGTKYDSSITVNPSTNTVTADIFNGGISYLTTAPSAANTSGIKFVVLDSEPSTKYNGYIYIITSSSS